MNKAPTGEIQPGLYSHSQVIIGNVLLAKPYNRSLLRKEFRQYQYHALTL